MRVLLAAICAVTVLGACSAQETTAPVTETVEVSISSEVTFNAADGGVIYADLLVSDAGKSAPLILFFHQASANGRAEYSAIVPELATLGYNLLIVDQRSGGSHFGGTNRTVDARGGKTPYCPAYVDLEAALSFVIAEGFDGPRFAWGSSYSAALVLKLAGEHGDDLTGVLAFSPASGSGMGACAANQFVSDVKIPAIGFRPQSEMSDSGKAQQDLFIEHGLEFYVAADGVHGSSMLDPSRANGDTGPTWDAVWEFLDLHSG